MAASAQGANGLAEMRAKPFLYCLRLTFSDLPSPAEAGFAKAGNRFPLFLRLR